MLHLLRLDILENAAGVAVGGLLGILLAASAGLTIFAAPPPDVSETVENALDASASSGLLLSIETHSKTECFVSVSHWLTKKQADVGPTSNELISLGGEDITPFLREEKTRFKLRISIPSTVASGEWSYRSAMEYRCSDSLNLIQRQRVLSEFVPVTILQQ